MFPDMRVIPKHDVASFNVVIEELPQLMRRTRDILKSKKIKLQLR